MEQKSHLLAECKRISGDCEYNAETYHQIGAKAERTAFFVKFVPAAVTLISGVLILNGVPAVVAWLSVICGFILSILSVLDPDKKARDHIKAAKDYTVLKHDARAHSESWAAEMGDTEFYVAVRLLRERYNNIVAHTPKTDDKAFEKARMKIKSGRHDPDPEPDQVA